MKTVVGVLAIAAVGIHCSAPVSDGDTAQLTTPELVAAAEQGRGPAKPVAPSTPPAPPSDDAADETAGADLTMLVHNGAWPTITSSVSDENGARYATGTFVGVVAIGDTVIKSRGDKDVFLLKLDPAGKFLWVRAVGSASAESAPRVTLESTGRVSVLGMTTGEMDCGSGPLPTWSSDTFFLCIFGGDGLSLVSGVFPTGAP